MWIKRLSFSQTGGGGGTRLRTRTYRGQESCPVLLAGVCAELGGSYPSWSMCRAEGSKPSRIVCVRRAGDSVPSCKPSGQAEIRADVVRRRWAPKRMHCLVLRAVEGPLYHLKDPVYVRQNPSQCLAVHK